MNAIANIKIRRDADYGSFSSSQATALVPAILCAMDLLKRAIKADELDAPYVDVDKKHRGKVLNYDIYDIKHNRAGRVVAALFQHRETTCTKYGNSPTKDYILITSAGKVKVDVEWLEDSKKVRVVRHSRSALYAGEIIDALAGKPSIEFALRGGDKAARAKAAKVVNADELYAALQRDPSDNMIAVEIARRKSRLPTLKVMHGQVSGAAVRAELAALIMQRTFVIAKHAAPAITIPAVSVSPRAVFI